MSHDRNEDASNCSEREPDRLLEELSSLPCARASEGFTARVLQRLDERETRRWRPMTLALPIAAALILALLVPMWIKRNERAADAAHLEAMEAALRQMQAEIATVNQEFDSQPLVYLGGDEQVAFTLDLREMTQTVQAQPVSNDPNARPRRERP